MEQDVRQFIYDISEVNDIVDHFIEYVHDIDYEWDCYSNNWQKGNSILLKLPLDIQIQLLEEYIDNEDMDDHNYEFTRSIYYWSKRVDKISDNVHIKKLKLLIDRFRGDMERYIESMDRYILSLNTSDLYFKSSKYISLIFLVLKPSEAKKYISFVTIADDAYYLFLGYLFSNATILDIKESLNILIRRGVDLMDACEVIKTIIKKFTDMGYDMRNVFGYSIDAVQFD